MIKTIYKLILLYLLFTLLTTAALCDKNGQMKASPNYLVILVHGIGGHSYDFSDVEHKQDVNNLGLKGYLYGNMDLGANVFTYDFTDDLQSCEDNAHELGDRNYVNQAAEMNGLCWIEKAKSDFAHRKNYESFEAIPDKERPEKIILIAHSLGGVGCDYYLTSPFYEKDVKKLITLDAPHAGADGYTWYTLWKQDRGLVAGAVDYGLDYAMQETLKSLLSSDTIPDSTDMYVSAGHMTLGIYGMACSKALVSILSYPGSLWAKKNFAEAFNDVKGYHWDRTSFTDDYANEILLSSYFGFGRIGAWDEKDHGPGLYEMDPDGDFIKEMKQKTLVANSNPIDFRLVSARGTPTPNKNYIGKYYGMNPFLIGWLMPTFSDYNDLPTEGQKVYAALLGIAIPGSFPFNDGSMIIPYYSSRGDGVQLFNNNTKKYSYLFKSEAFENAAKTLKTEHDCIVAVVAALALAGYPCPTKLAQFLMIGPVIELSYVEFTAPFVYMDVREALFSHAAIIDKVWTEPSPNIIEQALFDTPMATVTHLDTDVDTGEYNTSQKIVHTGIVQPVEILNTSEASDSPPYAADRSVSLIFNEGTTSEVEKYTSDMLVKVPVTQISGVIHDFKPLMLSSFQISENFAAWQEFHPSSCSTQTDSQGFKYIECQVNKFKLHMDEWGRYTISGLNFAEGQNLIAFKLTNRAQYSSNQVLKVIQNTIPMQASKYLPESNYMTNNPYQPIGVEFNKCA